MDPPLGWDGLGRAGPPKSHTLINSSFGTRCRPPNWDAPQVGTRWDALGRAGTHRKHHQTTTFHHTIKSGRTAPHTFHTTYYITHSYTLTTLSYIHTTLSYTPSLLGGSHTGLTINTYIYIYIYIYMHGHRLIHSSTIITINSIITINR